MVNTGLIGLGNLGTKHAENIMFKIPNANLLAVCARRESVINNFGDKYNIKYRYTDYDEMLKNREIDAIVIATSVNVHSSMVIKALNTGFNVFVEKPLGLTTEEAIKAEKTAEENPEQVFMTGFMRRFDPSYAEAKRKIEKGLIGDPVMFRGYSLDPDRESEKTPERRKNNGTWFYEMIVHDIDLARWFLESEAESIRTIGGCYKYKKFEKDNDIDNACSLISFKNNTMAMLYTGRTAPHGSHVESEIVGTEGILRINPAASKDKINIYNRDGVLSESAENYYERFKEAFVNEMQEFINCIEQKRKPEITAYDSRMACETANNVYEAYRTQKLIKL